MIKSPWNPQTWNFLDWFAPSTFQIVSISPRYRSSSVQQYCVVQSDCEYVLYVECHTDWLLRSEAGFESKACFHALCFDRRNCNPTCNTPRGWHANTNGGTGRRLFIGTQTNDDAKRGETRREMLTRLERSSILWLTMSYA